MVLESEWDLDCAADDAGRSVLVGINEDGYSKLELRDPETLELRGEVPLPRRGRRRAAAVLQRRLAARVRDSRRRREPFDVYVFDLDSHELTSG